MHESAIPAESKSDKYLPQTIHLAGQDLNKFNACVSPSVSYVKTLNCWELKFANFIIAK